MLNYTGCKGSTITTFPQRLYVQDGSRGILRCQNRSDNDNFYNNIGNAVWYRFHTNGTSETIDRTESVYFTRHILYFDPLYPDDEGEYCCCIPSGTCSEPSIVAKAGKFPLQLLPFSE